MFERRTVGPRALSVLLVGLYLGISSTSLLLESDSQLQMTHDSDVRSSNVIQTPMADLSISNETLYAKSGNRQVNSSTFGRELMIYAEIANLGDSVAPYFALRLGIRSVNLTPAYNSTLEENSIAMPPNSTVTQLYDWRVTLTIAGDYELWAYLDPYRNVTESNYSNNWVAVPFRMDPLLLLAYVIPGADSVTAGELVSFTAAIFSRTVEYPYSEYLNDFPGLEAYLVDTATGLEVPGTRLAPASTDGRGEITASIKVPKGTRDGDYRIGIDYQGASLSDPMDLTFHVNRYSVWTDLGLIGWVVGIAVVAIFAAILVILYRSPQE